MKRLFMLSLAISMAAASISAFDRQVSPRFGEGMPSSRSKTNYDEMASVYGRRPNKRVQVERPSMILSPEYMQKKEMAQARRAEQSAARRAQMRADREVALAQRRESIAAYEAKQARKAALAEERAPMIEALSRAYEGTSNDVPNLRGERLAAYEKLEKRPSIVPNWSRDWDQAQIDTEKIEQWRPSKVYNALPERSWKDYFKDKSGFSSDWYAFKDRPLQRTREGLATMGRGVYNALPARYTTRAREYDRAFNAEPVQVPRDSFAEEYEKMYEGDEFQPQYGNRASELESAYGVPYAERIRSRMPSLSGASAYVPSWESVKGVPSKMWSKMPSFRSEPTSADILRENAAQAQMVDQSTQQPSYWESVKNAPANIWNYFGENKRRALEETRKLEAEQAQNAGRAGYRIPIEKGLQYIPGTDAYSQRQTENLKQQFEEAGYELKPIEQPTFVNNQLPPTSQPSYWNRFINYFGENKRRALEETRKQLEAEQAQNAGPVGYRIPVEKGLQYIPGTPAYKQRMENEARDKQARERLQETRQEILNLQRKLGI